ncbi:MAG: hypothetical protein KGL39_09245 [Patescibacteria group bacterium]|nr:hypothetical protein [Patescibacteria group bacterium]
MKKLLWRTLTAPLPAWATILLLTVAVAGAAYPTYYGYFRSPAGIAADNGAIPSTGYAGGAGTTSFNEQSNSVTTAAKQFYRNAANGCTGTNYSEEAVAATPILYTLCDGSFSSASAQQENFPNATGTFYNAVFEGSNNGSHTTTLEFLYPSHAAWYEGEYGGYLSFIGPAGENYSLGNGQIHAEALELDNEASGDQFTWLANASSLSLSCLASGVSCGTPYTVNLNGAEVTANGGFITGGSISATGNTSAGSFTDTAGTTNSLACFDSGKNIVGCTTSNVPLHSTALLIDATDGCGAYSGSCNTASTACLSGTDCGNVTIAAPARGFCPLQILSNYTTGVGPTTPGGNGWMAVVDNNISANHTDIHFFNFTGASFDFTTTGHAVAAGFSCALSG